MKNIIPDPDFQEFAKRGRLRLWSFNDALVIRVLDGLGFALNMYNLQQLRYTGCAFDSATTSDPVRWIIQLNYNHIALHTPVRHLDHPPPKKRGKKKLKQKRNIENNMYVVLSIQFRETTHFDLNS